MESISIDNIEGHDGNSFDNNSISEFLSSDEGEGEVIIVVQPHKDTTVPCTCWGCRGDYNWVAEKEYDESVFYRNKDEDKNSSKVVMDDTKVNDAEVVFLPQEGEGGEGGEGKSNKKGFVFGGVFVCEDCTFQTVTAAKLRVHKETNHQFRPTDTYNKCPFPGCNFKGKDKGAMKRHNKSLHGIGVIWKQCPYCEYKAKETSHMRRHMNGVHQVGPINWYTCEFCPFKAKQASDLHKHRSAKHNVDIKWFPCPDCDYKAKQTSHLKAHQKFKHGIGIEWFKCEDCAYKAKSLGNLKAHMRKRHDYEGYESVVIQEPIPSVGKKSKKGPGRLKKG